MDATVDPDVQAIVLWWASGMAKTEGVAASIIGTARVVAGQSIAIYSSRNLEESRALRNSTLFWILKRLDKPWSIPQSSR